MAPGALQGEAVRKQLDRILASPGFCRNERLSRFLRFVVERHLEGRDPELKESLVAIEVFGRKPDYDPKQDSIVRTEAGRLRARLIEYYASDGSCDLVVIELPKGGYRPHWRAGPPLVLPGTAPAPPARRVSIGVFRTFFQRHPKLIVSLSAGVLVTLAAVGYWVSHRAAAAPGAAPRIQALAVLPLVNLSGDPAQEFLADGITEALIADLAQIGALRVISRTSVMQFKNSKKLLTEIARQLKVDAVVEASVLRSGNRVRITAELIDASDRQLWAKTYERNLDDVLDLQNEVGRAIAGEIQAKVTPREQSRLARSPKVNPGAVEAYLNCRFYWNKLTVDSIVKSIEYCQQAIKLDQNYGEAYAALAIDWKELAYLGAVSSAEVRPKVIEAVTKALQIDDTLAEAHVALASLKAQEWDWAAAETEIKKAIGLNPGLAHAHQAYSDELRHRGRVEESIAEARRGLDLDPVAALANEGLADAYKSARQYDRAIEQYLTTLGLYPDQASARNSLGWCYVYEGMYDQGIEEIQKSLKGYGETPNTSDELAYIYAVRGQKSKARQILARLQNLAKRAPVGPDHFVLIYAGLGKNDEALSWLEKAYQRHSQMMWWLKVDPRFDDLRPNPRFQELMRRVGLP
jgi:TolB-like protein/tetratricopeptide (TPR) repeat protein